MEKISIEIFNQRRPLKIKKHLHINRFSNYCILHVNDITQT